MHFRQAVWKKVFFRLFSAPFRHTFCLCFFIIFHSVFFVFFLLFFYIVFPERFSRFSSSRPSPPCNRQQPRRIQFCQSRPI